MSRKPSGPSDRRRRPTLIYDLELGEAIAAEEVSPRGCSGILAAAAGCLIIWAGIIWLIAAHGVLAALTLLFWTGVAGVAASGAVDAIRAVLRRRRSSSR